MEVMEQLLSKKNLIVIFILITLAVSIPLGINLLQKQQQLKSRAAEEAQNQIRFTGSGVNCDNQGRCTTPNDKVDLQLQAPWPQQPTATPTP